MSDPTPRPWEQLGERALRTGWVPLVERTYRLPDGTQSTWEVVTGRDSASVLALTHDGLVVVIRQFRAGPGQVLLGLPGGFLDPGETPEQAGVRELAEETGYTVDSARCVGWSWASSSATARKHVVVAQGARRTREPALEVDEDIAADELSVPELRELVRAGGQTFSAVDIYLALDHAGLL